MPSAIVEHFKKEIKKAPATKDTIIVFVWSESLKKFDRRAFNPSKHSRKITPGQIDETFEPMEASKWARIPTCNLSFCYNCIIPFLYLSLIIGFSTLMIMGYIWALYTFFIVVIFLVIITGFWLPVYAEKSLEESYTKREKEIKRYIERQNTVSSTAITGFYWKVGPLAAWISVEFNNRAKTVIVTNTQGDEEDDGEFNRQAQRYKTISSRPNKSEMGMEGGGDEQDDLVKKLTAGVEEQKQLFKKNDENEGKSHAKNKVVPLMTPLPVAPAPEVINESPVSEEESREEMRDRSSEGGEEMAKGGRGAGAFRLPPLKLPPLNSSRLMKQKEEGEISASAEP